MALGVGLKRLWSLNVCFWHKVDIAQLSSNDRYGGKADIKQTRINVRF